MKNTLRTLSLTLGLGLFLTAVQPAHAEFFPEPFQTHTTPVSASATTPTAEQTEKLQVRIAPAGAQVADPQWSAPLSSPTHYAPMGPLQTSAPAVAAPASAPIAVPSRDSQTVDNWQTPLSNPAPFDPMR